MKRSKIEYLIFTAGITVALLKHLINKINSNENISIEMVKIICILIIIILTVYTLYALQNISSGNIYTRCHADEGLFCITLLPIAFLFNCIHYNNIISPLYKVLTIINIEMSITSIVLLLYYTKKYKKQLLLLLFMINFMTINLLTNIIKFSYILIFISVICQILFICLQHIISTTFSKSFTIGELNLICQGIVLFLSASVFYLSNFMISVETINHALYEVNTVIAITLIGLFLIFVSIKLIPLLKTPLYFYIVCIFIEVGITFIIMYKALEQNPLLWLFYYLTNSHQKVMFVGYLFTCIGATIAFIIWQSNIGKSFLLTRKIFHISIIIVYIPAFYLDIELLLLSSAGILAVFLMLECIRILNIPPLGKIIYNTFDLFLDEKDCGLLIVSHIYLLVGSTASLWINPHHQLSLSMLSGILTIGFGDSVAAIIGILWGKHKWPNTKKTYEGTLSALLVQYLLTHWLLYLINKNILNLFNSIYILVVTCFSVLLETFTTQFDNLILPLFLYIMLIFL